MTLATANEITHPRRTRLLNSSRRLLGVDALLMAGSLAICGILFDQGGLEAAALAVAGAVVAARKAPAGDRLMRAYSGGFAGLFIGALFAAFFHGAMVWLVQLF